MTPTAYASTQILNLVAAGMDPIDALRQVCGADAVDAMIDTLYHALRLRAQAGR